MSVRKKLIDALSFPRQLVHDGLELDKCPHNGFYSESDPRCGRCEQQIECEWLLRNDEFVALQQKPLADLVDALEFALMHVNAYAGTAGHEVRACHCEVCGWLRKAQRLYHRLNAQGFPLTRAAISRFEYRPPWIR